MSNYWTFHTWHCPSWTYILSITFYYVSGVIVSEHWFVIFFFYQLDNLIEQCSSPNINFLLIWESHIQSRFSSNHIIYCVLWLLNLTGMSFTSSEKCNQKQKMSISITESHHFLSKILIFTTEVIFQSSVSYYSDVIYFLLFSIILNILPMPVYLVIFLIDMYRHLQRLHKVQNSCPRLRHFLVFLISIFDTIRVSIPNKCFISSWLGDGWTSNHFSNGSALRWKSLKISTPL